MKHTYIVFVFISIILKINYLNTLAVKSDLLRDSLRNHRTKRQGDTCSIPPISNGKVNILRQKTSSNAPASSYLLLNVTCDHNYILYPPNNNIILCINGFWDQEIPQCIQCGQRLDNTHKPFIVNGTLSKFGDFPWHVGIYRKGPSDSVPLYICGGSLINDHSILTVSHCFTDESGKFKESSEYYVAAGKYYSSYNYDKDKYAQKRKAARIDIHPRYKGYFTNYAWDIAVVLVAKPFEISNLVQPICVDWTNDFENKQLIPKNYGEVAGWGSTETNFDIAAHELRVLKVPFIEAEKCTSLVPNTFIRYITPDKFCAGYTNGSSVCGGDSGSGLVFQRQENRDTRYYIRGIVSVGVQIDGRCDDYKYSTYTKVSEYLSFIRESVTKPLPIEISEVVTESYSKNVPCLTPNGEHANCISIYKCQIFVDALKSKPTPETQKFMQDSRCGGGDEIDVCCGSTIHYLSTIHSNPVTTKPIVHRNLNLLPSPGVCGRQVRRGQARIFGGNVTTLLDFPWMALVEYGNNEKSAGFRCSGVLINERYVLTAAHCVGKSTGFQISNPPFRVRLGEYNIDTKYDCVNISESTGNLPNGKMCADSPMDVDIERIIVHPLFKSESPITNDIALLRLTKNMNYTDFIKPICLPLNGEKSLPGAEMVIAGWGTKEKDKSNPIKRRAFLPIIPDEECRRNYEENANIQLKNSHICAGGAEGIDSCVGDSGGPLMGRLTDSLDMYAEGIFSFGPRTCEDIKFPSVFIRVSYSIEWILDNIQP